MGLQFEKLNNDWAPHPDVSRPMIEPYGANLTAKFLLNSFIYPKFKENDWGDIEFSECVMFRGGDPNDEGFYGGPDERINDSRWHLQNYPDLEYLNFYRVINSDWRTNFDSSAYVNGEVMEKYANNLDSLNHYLLFLRDGTLECVARSYKARLPSPSLLPTSV